MPDRQALTAAVEEEDLDAVCSFICTQDDFDEVVNMLPDGAGSKFHMLLCGEFPEFAPTDDEDEEEDEE